MKFFSHFSKSKGSRVIVLAAILGFLSIGVVAQDPVVDNYIDRLRSDLKSGKVGVYNQVMQLTDEEARVFWPVYLDYEKELFAWGDRRVSLAKEFVDAQVTQTWTDKKAEEFARKWFRLQEDRLNLWRKYYKRIAKELSPVRAAQFVQIEHEFFLVIDLDLASRVPLIGTTDDESAPNQ